MVSSRNPLTWKLGEPLRLEIDQKRELINQLVGNLYPSIVWEEIERLSDEHKRITGIEYYGPNKRY